MRPNDQKIIQYLVETNNKPEYAARISKNAKLNKGEVTKRCDALEKGNILQSVAKHARSRGETPHYYLNESIDTLRVIGNDISLNMLAKAMQLECYRNLIPEIIDLFDEKLKKQCEKSLSDLDREILSIHLKHTVSGLMFILNDSDYNASIFKNEYRNSCNNLNILKYGFEWGAELGIQESYHEINIDEVVKKITRRLNEYDIDMKFNAIDIEYRISDLFTNFVRNDESLGYAEYRKRFDEVMVYCGRYSWEDYDEEPPEEMCDPYEEYIPTEEEIRLHDEELCLHDEEMRRLYSQIEEFEVDMHRIYEKLSMKTDKLRDTIRLTRLLSADGLFIFKDSLPTK